MTEYLRNVWYVAALASEVGEALHAVRLLDEPVLLYRTHAGAPVAMVDICPHRFVSLHKGRRVGDAVECLYHGLRFGADGRCTRSPYSDTPPPNAVVRTFPVVERHRMIWIWMGDPAAADSALIPDHSHLDDTPGRRFVAGHERFDGNYQLCNDNLMDLTHLFWLHASTIGGYKDEAGPVADEEYSVRQIGDQVHMRTLSPNVRKSPTGNGLPAHIELIDNWNDTIWEAPCAIKFRHGAVAAGTSREVWEPYMTQSHFATPATATTSHYFWAVQRGWDMDDAGDAKWSHFFGNIFRIEDAPIMADIEANMGGRDLWELKPVVLPRDRAALLVRRLLARRIAAEQSGAQPIAAE